METKEEKNGSQKEEEKVKKENLETGEKSKKEKIDTSLIIKDEQSEDNKIMEVKIIVKEKEKIEEIDKKIEFLQEEEIKNIKIEPKQEYTILVVHNITPNVTEEHLKEIFSNYGQINEVYIPINEDTQLKKTYAFIEFVTLENAKKAELYMDEGQIDGKIVRVEIIDKKNCVEVK